MSAGRIPTTANSPLTAKGDLFTYSTGSAKLAVGANATVLTADSTQPTGLSWATPASGGGKVLQVVTATYTTLKSIATTTMTDTDLTCNITPTLNTSKILVLVTQLVNTVRNTKKSNVGWQVMRGATVIAGSGSIAAFGPYAETLTSPLVSLRGILSASYLDSPATTSALTYKTQGCVEDTADSALANFNQKGTSPIDLLEIGA